MISAIIPAAGKGLRMRTETAKQYIFIAGKPILAHTIQSIAGLPAIDRIFTVVPKPDINYCIKNILPYVNIEKEVIFIPGGENRQDSVYRGLNAAKGSSFVLIHDGVRPFVSQDNINLCVKKAKETGACICAAKTFDTLKLVRSSIIVKTLDRDGVFLAQTPQAFKYDLIMKAHKKALKEGFTATDDAVLLEWMGANVSVIAGTRLNIKITSKEDLTLAEAILECLEKTKNIN